MESSQMVSWQSENFSAAELSPSISPESPLSPQFYDGSDPASPSSSGFKGLLHNTNAMFQQSQKPVLSPVLTSRAQTASSIFDELERLRTYDQNEFALGYKEESVNLNNNDLFEELADIEYTPPLFHSEDVLEVPRSPAAVSPAPSQITSVVPPTPSAVNAALSAEFKNILESLSSNQLKPAETNTSAQTPVPKAVASFGDLLQIAGIPTTTVGDECLVPVEFIGRPISGGLGAEEAESMDLDAIIISNDMSLVNESDLFALGLDDLSGQEVIMEGKGSDKTASIVNGVLPYWAKDLTVPLDELDTQMDRNLETLDALIEGDVSSAVKSVMPSSPIVLTAAYSPISGDEGEQEMVLEDAEVVEVIIPKKEPEPEPVKPKKKTEKRGRKPGKVAKDPRDKAIRKKEQNKTAATRYRQKKKQELVATLVVEDDLQQIHDDLEKQKEKLGAEVRMMRSLLRDMLQVRKNRVVPALTTVSVSPSAGKLTASSIVQAQRLASRRK